MISCAEASLVGELTLKVLPQVLPAQGWELSHITVLKGEWQIVPGVDDPEGKGVFADPGSGRGRLEAGVDIPSQ